jgi:hypothetical protein
VHGEFRQAKFISYNMLTSFLQHNSFIRQNQTVLLARMVALKQFNLKMNPSFVYSGAPHKISCLDAEIVFTGSSLFYVGSFGDRSITSITSSLGDSKTAA